MRFENLTEETGTGTGLTISLSGATTGNTKFNKSFVDGELVYYFIKDSGGVIWVEGLGIYNSSGDSITRSDTRNYNGTAIDKMPTTNITLSGGAHTVTCAVGTANMGGIDTFTATTQDANFINFPDNIISTAARVVTDQALVLTSAFFASPIRFTKLVLRVVVADAGGLCEVGYFQVDKDGKPGVLACNAVIDITTTGVKVVSCGNTFLPAGRYYMAMWTDSSVASLDAASERSHGGAIGGYTFRNDNPGVFRITPSPNTGIPIDLTGETFTSTDANRAYVVGVEA